MIAPMKLEIEMKAKTIAALTAMITGFPLLLGVSDAYADVASPISGGWVLNVGQGPGGPNENDMFTGYSRGLYYNSWAAFQIAPGSYSSAVLSFAPRIVGNAVGTTIVFYDVSTGLSTLTSLTHLNPSIAAYQDLMNGNSYGQVTLSNNATVSIELNADALSDINSHAGETFIIGFTAPTLNASPSDLYEENGILIMSDLPNLPTLTLSPITPGVPEPSTWAMMILGFAGLGVMTYRKRKTSGFSAIAA
jgi:hypothetical protein